MFSKTNNNIHNTPVKPVNEPDFSEFKLTSKDKQYKDRTVNFEQLEITMKNHLVQDDVTLPWFEQLSSTNTRYIVELYEHANSHAIANGKEPLIRPNLDKFASDDEWFIVHFDNSGFVSWYEKPQSRDEDKYYCKILN